MANPQHLQILQQGVEAWNAWRRQNRDITPDLSAADLSEATLIEADLTRANLAGATLTYANLADANLSGANLPGADFTGADLTGATLAHTLLSGADLTGATLAGAILTGANFTGATLTHADLAGADLSAVTFYFDCIISIFDITPFSSRLSQACRVWVITVRSKLMQVGLATTKQEFLKECEVAPGISQNEFARPYPGDTVTN